MNTSNFHGSSLLLMTIRKSIKNIYRPIGWSEQVTCNEMCSDIDQCGCPWNPHWLDHEIKSFNDAANSLRLSCYQVQIDILNTPAVKIIDQDCILLSVEHPQQRTHSVPYYSLKEHTHTQTWYFHSYTHLLYGFVLNHGFNTNSCFPPLKKPQYFCIIGALYLCLCVCCGPSRPPSDPSLMPALVWRRCGGVGLKVDKSAITCMQMRLQVITSAAVRVSCVSLPAVMFMSSLCRHSCNESWSSVAFTAWRRCVATPSVCLTSPETPGLACLSLLASISTK